MKKKTDEYIDEYINTDDYEDETDDEKYEFKTNVNKSLSKILKIPEFKSNDDTLPVWKPPEEHGLNNSQYIIPVYYNNSRTNSITMDYYAMIKDDIRNMRTLNKHQLEYIKNLCDDKKNELFDIFNDCIVTINDVLNTI